MGGAMPSPRRNQERHAISGFLKNVALTRIKLRKHLKHFAVQSRSGSGQEVWIPNVKLAAIPARDDAPCFANQKDARGDVPSVDLRCPKGVQGAAGHMRQIQRGGARTTHRLRYLGGLDEV